MTRAGNLTRDFLARHQAPMPARRILLAGLGTVLIIGLIGGLGESLTMQLLVASLGSSCALVFTVPGGALAQPANVVGGQLVCTVAGLAVGQVLPTTWWSISLAVGIAVMAMAALRVTHPPAGANPIIIMTTNATWTGAIVPIAIGAVAVVLLAALFHRATGTRYPIRRPPEPRKRAR